MPKIERWDNLPENVRQHLIDRMRDRSIQLADLNLLRPLDRVAARSPGRRLVQRFRFFQDLWPGLVSQDVPALRPSRRGSGRREVANVDIAFDGFPAADYTQIARALMGLTHIKLNIANPARPKRSIELSFLVDSGTIYSVIPSPLLRKLGVRPHSKRAFTLADGTEITRKIGDVLFRLDGRQGAAPVIFGEKEDSTLLGSVSLEGLGMMLDPMKRELRPLPMLLASHNT